MFRMVKKSVVVEQSKEEADRILDRIEKAGRICYKSDGDNAPEFIRKIITRGHLAVIEHGLISAHYVCSRGMSHELVRHRIASYCQESTRYCNYGKEKFGRQITIIQPYWWNEADSETQRIFTENCEQSAYAYFELLDRGYPPQAARDVLPQALKTEIYVSANLREWRTILNLRCAKAAHPEIRALMLETLEQLYVLMPCVFEDQYREFHEAN